MEQILTCVSVRQIHFEPSSYCNAACQLCPRHEITEGIYRRSGHLVESHLHMDIVRRLLADPLLHPRCNWLLCGNLGEPMMHPDILDMVRELQARSGEHFWCSLHSNGGIGSVDTWHQLGKLLRDPHGQVLFGLDGLEDTNHIYRRNTRWDVIMRNAQAFIAAGGRAVWKFIDFPHNHHQIEAARQLSQQLGFYAFTVDANAAGGHDPLPELQYSAEWAPVSALDLDDFDPIAANASMRQDTDLSCEHVKYGSIYIDAQGRVWPCCFLVTVLNNPDQRRQRIARRFLLEPYGPDWNDLNQHDLSQILQNPYWDDLYASLEDNSGIYMCAQACGQSPFRTRDRAIG